MYISIHDTDLESLEIILNLLRVSLAAPYMQDVSQNNENNLTNICL